LNAGSAIIGAVGLAVVARLLPVDQIGVIAIATLILFAVNFAASPIDADAVVNYVAKNRAAGRVEESSGVFYKALVANILPSTLVTIIILFLAEPLSSFVLGTRHETLLFLMLALEVPLQSEFPILVGAAMALQRFEIVAAVGILQSALKQVFSIALLLLWQLSATSLVAAWVISDAVGYAVLLFFVVTRIGPLSFRFQISRLLRFSLPLRVLSLGRYFYDRFDFLILTGFVSFNALGIYNVVLLIFGPILEVPQLTSTALFPTYVELRAKNGPASLEAATKMASRYITYVSLPLTLGLVTISPQLLWLIGGPSYTSGAGALAILGASLAFSFLSAALVPLVMTSEATSKLLGLFVLTSAAGSALAWILIPALGILGAAVSRGAAMFINFCLLIVILRAALKVRFDREALLKGTTASLGMAVCVLIAQHFFASPVLVPVHILIGAAAYLVLLRELHAIHSYDIALAESVLGSRFRNALAPVLSFLVPVHDG
jgi:O-antigen/teichoic acid export membrane protein